MKRRKQLTLILLILVALALRIWYLRINPLLPQFSNADDGDYYRRALRLAVTGHYVDDAWLIRPPFHVLIFAGWIRLALAAGRSPDVGVRLIQAFQAGLGVLMVPLCYVLAGRLFNRRAGLLFAALWAIWFPFVELPATLFSEPIYLFLFTLHIWLLLRFDDLGRRRDLVLAGLVLGMAALTRSPALYALAFAAPWLFWRALRSGATGRSAWSWGAIVPALRAAARPYVPLVVATLLVVLPWTARNWVVYHRIIPIDTLGPINLWLDLGGPGERDAKIRALQAVPQADRQGLATQKVEAILAQDPLRPVRGMWPTFQHIWKAQFVEDYFVKRSFFTRPLRGAAPLGLPGDLIWLVFTFAGFLGILSPATDRPFKVVTGLWLLYSIVTVLVFHVEPRYLLPIWLLLGLYGAGALACLPGFLVAFRRRAVRGLVTAAALFLVAALFVTYRDYPVIVARGIRREGEMWRGDAAYSRGDYQTAAAAFQAAIRVDPDFVDAHESLALALSAEGRAAEGLSVVRPGDSRRSALVAGVLRRATGDLSGARQLLKPAEDRSGEDAQHWSQVMLRPEARTSLVLGDDALDLGYISGFGGSEQAGDRTMRWLLGEGSVILPLPKALGVGSSLLLDLAGPLPLRGPLEVTINGRWHASLTVATGWRRYHLALPDGLAGAKRLRLDLRAPTYMPALDNPRSDDARPLSVMLHRVGVE